MAKQKVVIKVLTADAKKRAKVLQIVVGFHGVSSISEENGLITVVGDGIDSVNITECIRKKTKGCAELVSVGPVEEKKKEEKKEEKEEKPPAPVCVQLPPCRPWSNYCYDTCYCTSYPCYF